MRPETNPAAHVLLPEHMRAALREQGFVRNGRIYRKENLTFALSGRWYVLDEESNGHSCQAPSRQTGQPGLWKWVQNGEPPHRVFEVPAWCVSDKAADDRLDESGLIPFARLLDWALESRVGRVPLGWLMPDADLVESWIPTRALTLQAKGQVRQGELILRPDRWALSMQILPRLAQDLPEQRRKALEKLTDEAQRQWAMVRIGCPADATSPALIAEVDFTGAPHSELLFSAGLDVIRHMVAWLVETATVLGDPSVAIASLTRGGDNNPSSAERRTP